MNNSSLRNFEDAPLRLNLASRDRRTGISDLCPEADTRALAVANLHGNSTRVLLLARANLLYGRSRLIYFYSEIFFRHVYTTRNGILGSVAMRTSGIDTRN